MLLMSQGFCIWTLSTRWFRLLSELLASIFHIILRQSIYDSSERCFWRPGNFPLNCQTKGLLFAAHAAQVGCQQLLGLNQWISLVTLVVGTLRNVQFMQNCVFGKCQMDNQHVWQGCHSENTGLVKPNAGFIHKMQQHKWLKSGAVTFASHSVCHITCL